MLAEQRAKPKPLRVLITIESGDPSVSRGAADFLAKALKGPLDLSLGQLTLTLTFQWSLASRVAEIIKAGGDSVLDFDLGEDRVTIVTKRGLVITITVDVRSNGYVSEVEGVVDFEQAPFEISES